MRQNASSLEKMVEAFTNGSSLETNPDIHQVYLLSQPLQCLTIVLIILVAILCNGLIIHNIGKCQVKKTNTFKSQNL